MTALCSAQCHKRAQFKDNQLDLMIWIDDNWVFAGLRSCSDSPFFCDKHDVSVPVDMLRDCKVIPFMFFWGVFFSCRCSLGGICWMDLNGTGD